MIATRPVSARPLVLAAMSLAAGSLAGCGRGEQTAASPRTVETVVVAPASGAVSSVYSGQVVSRYSGNYGFRIGGMITERAVELGQQVRAGQMLARLDPQDVQVTVRSAAAQTSAAAAQSEAQVTDLARARRLLAEGFISQAEFDRLQAGTRSAQAQLRSARAQQTGADQQLSYTVLRASRAGVITAVHGDVGEVVPAGQPVVVVESPGTVEVATSVPEGEVARFRAAQLGVRLWTTPSRIFPARIRTLSAAANAQTRTFDARIVFDAPPGTAAIGSTAEVVIKEPVERQALRVPLAAITRQGQRSVVWVVSGDPATVQPRSVTIEATQDNDVLIASGIRKGEHIVSAGAHLLKAGEVVHPVPSSAFANR
ncbi:putative efflux system protein [Caenibius tardaugens NBRC 16725]|uniref:Putative efflux system protein n=1 Tax=Caenibius tardaugens NBRC 16725 TaxID=1219035 RepID=U2YM07_9SPHN|nr:efflux RND transporter periplasmic adaptor subunit [Caenibius tardaugens]GAD49720.1 putative efflux system protein [Caenibius tardaugens NBRC 16725]